MGAERTTRPTAAELSEAISANLHDPRSDAEKILELQEAVEFLDKRCKALLYALGGLLSRASKGRLDSPSTRAFAAGMEQDLYPFDFTAGGRTQCNAMAERMRWWRFANDNDPTSKQRKANHGTGDELPIREAAEAFLRSLEAVNDDRAEELARSVGELIDLKIGPAS